MEEGNMSNKFTGGGIMMYHDTLSLSMQALLASVWVLIGNIDSLIDSFNAAIWVFYGLVFAGFLIMRVTHRDQPRPYKVTTRILCVLALIVVTVVCDQ